ncbi:hypothetical protein [Desulfurispira natronophila]|uniref:Response regulatory domain-containing protein n=1 Tax=Desulfurispira natronophila TaxID=682562 RepID=A0A7W7Y5F5_9BACT|nr:hypothetical protein [Desulfurispira natronophila]MBB5022137.1 hypothetical protein [Desulfurispira natronophila]
MRPIIVADQSPSLRKLFELTFGDEYEVLFADNEENLREVVQQNPPGLVFLDAEFTADAASMQSTITALHEDEPLPIILLKSDFSEIDDLEGITQEIKKPFDPEDLLECYQKHALDGATMGDDESDLDDIFSGVSSNSLDEEVSREINDLFRPETDESESEEESLDEALGDLLDEEQDQPADLTTEEDDSEDDLQEDLSPEQQDETTEEAESASDDPGDLDDLLDDEALQELGSVLDGLDDDALGYDSTEEEDLLETQELDDEIELPEIVDDDTLDSTEDGEPEESVDFDDDSNHTEDQPDTDEDSNPYLDIPEPEETTPEPQPPAHDRTDEDQHLRLKDLEISIPADFTPKVYFPEPKGEFTEMRFVVDRSHMEEFLRNNLRQHLQEILEDHIKEMLPEIARQVVEEELERIKQIKIDDI